MREVGRSAPPGSPRARRDADSAPRRSARAWWIHRLTAAILAPLLFLGALEAALRTVGFGHPSSFFIRIPRRDAVTTSPWFGWRFFPPEIARRPEPCDLAARKGPGSFRVFVLGESAAMGTPDPAFGFGRILEAMLRDRFPSIRFEVVNAAMTAINSHAILPIARECADLDADLFVVYAGNNEVVGPFGAGTVFRAYSPSLPVIRAGIWARSTRTGQWLEGLAGFGGRGPTNWRGMEMFLANRVAAEDPRLEKVYGHFERNLDDICEVAGRRGAKVLLCTVAVNLRDCAPFASVHRAGLSAPDLTEWDRRYRDAVGMAEAGRHDRAVDGFLEAARLDSQYAELPYRLAGSYLALGRTDAAAGAFGRARDLDALRFRADSRINGIIRRVAERGAPRGVTLVDAERALGTGGRNPSRVPGRDLFYEHVHLNFEGNYRLAGIVFEAAVPIMRDRLPGWAAAPAPPLSRERCRDLIGLTGWGEYRMHARMTELMDRPPFTGQLDHEATCALRYRELKAFRLANASPAPSRGDEACRAVARAVEGQPVDLSGRMALVGLLQDRGDYAAAEAQCRWLLDRIPENPWFHGGLGDVLSLQGRTGEAIAEYREMGRLLPGLASPLVQAGVALAKGGKSVEAEAEFRRALEIDPGSEVARTGLARVLEARGRPEEARQALVDGLGVSRERGDARLEGILRGGLGGLELRRGRPREAIEECRRALAADRKAGDRQAEVEVLLTIGDACAALGDLAEAERSCRSALKLAEEMDHLPGQAGALAGLGTALLRRPDGDLDEALRAFASALEIQRELEDLPGQANSLAGAGDAHRRREDWEKALASYGQALEIRTRLGDLPGQAVALTAIGNAQIGNRKVAEAIGSHARALELYRRTGSPEGQANALSNLGLCRAKQGELGEAASLLAQARSIYLRLSDRGPELQAVEEMLSRLRTGP